MARKKSGGVFLTLQLTYLLLRDFYLTGVTRYRGTEISARDFYATNACLIIKAKGNIPTAGKKKK